MRRSEWRQRADDPKGLFGWWWRGMVQSRWILCVPLLPISLALVWDRPWLVMLPWWAVMLGNRLHRKWTPDLLQPMLLDPAPEGQFRAKVEYRRKGIVTGRDEMALVVVDGWLHAEGVRSHFALRPEDVQRLQVDSMTQINLDRRGRCLLSDGSEIKLSGIDDLSYVSLTRWHYLDRRTEGEPTFPPAQVHPQEFARWTAWVMFGAMTWPTLNLIGALVSHGAEGRLAWMLSGFAIGGLATYLAATRLKALLRIEVEAKKALAGQALSLREPVVECGDLSPLGSGASAPPRPTANADARTPPR